jgi:hypothetical protein
MVAPTVVNFKDGPKILWNVGAKVGLASPNKAADVQLVQFAYRLMLVNLSGIPADLKAGIAKIQLGAICTGRADDPLVQTIVIHQKGRGGTQDGLVSVFNSTGLYVDSSGPHVHMLIILNNNIRDQMPDDYPRLDKHPLCPAGLKAEVIKVCGK